MNNSGAFIVGDWGTSNLRLTLCRGDGAVLAHRTGPGVAAARHQLADTYDGLVSTWTKEHGELPAVLCGMVGSSLGWLDAGYLSCPTTLTQLAESMAAARANQIYIVPGLSCENRYAAPEVMRGEETQLLGALTLLPHLQHGRHLLCLPGTHAKWVLLNDGAAEEFLTAPTGELFALLCQHSVLVSEDGARTLSNGPAFAQGLTRFNAYPDAQLLHRLFECRSMQLFNELSAPAAAPYLSGLLIGSDVAGALKNLDPQQTHLVISIVGKPELAQLYAEAVSGHGYSARVIDGDQAAHAGLVQLHGLLQARGVLP